MIKKITLLKDGNKTIASEGADPNPRPFPYIKVGLLKKIQNKSEPNSQARFSPAGLAKNGNNQFFLRFLCRCCKCVLNVQPKPAEQR